MEDKVVAHFKDGKTQRGFTQDFRPDVDRFHLLPSEGGGIPTTIRLEAGRSPRSTRRGRSGRPRRSTMTILHPASRVTAPPARAPRRARARAARLLAALAAFALALAAALAPAAAGGNAGRYKF